MKSLILSCVLVLGSVMPALALDGTLAWNANTEADLAGYNVFFGTGTPACSNLTNGLSPLLVTGIPVTLGKVTTYKHVGLPAIDGPACWELTAYDTVGNESPRSNRVTKVLNALPPVPPVGLNVVIP